ncbi:MAG: helix-turn-helix transcriptional regulator [Veillonellaceae bacterium]|nr:helix-turn-helix transcriptional regulator [Veillonellaceae bacterium]
MRVFSKLSSVPQSTIARIERGDNKSMETLSKLAYAMNKTLRVSFN